jgi:hypothetical protein
MGVASRRAQYSEIRRPVSISGVYRQSLDAYGLSLEADTPSVPNDGCYYVVFKGEIVGRFRSLTKAQAAFAAKRKSLNIAPVAAPPVSPDEVRRRELDTISNKRLLWTDEDFNRISKNTQGKKGTRSAG